MEPIATPPPPVLAWGLDFIHAVQMARNPALDLLFKGFTELGNTAFILAAIPLVFVWCGWRFGGRFSVSLMAIGWMNECVKLVVQEPRPFLYDATVKVVDAGGYSFPSGHSSFSVVFWGLLATLIGRRWAWPVAVVMIACIGFSRVYLGVHFPTDVACGWLFGAFVLFVLLKIAPKLGARNFPPPVLLAAAVVVPPLLLFLGQNDLIVTILAAAQGAMLGVLADRRWLPKLAVTRVALGRGALRALAAIALTVAVYAAFGQLVAKAGDFGQQMRWIQYVCVGVAVSFGALYTCRKFKI